MDIAKVKDFIIKLSNNYISSILTSPNPSYPQRIAFIQYLYGNLFFYNKEREMYQLYLLTLAYVYLKNCNTFIEESQRYLDLFSYLHTTYLNRHDGESMESDIFKKAIKIYYNIEDHQQIIIDYFC